MLRFKCPHCGKALKIEDIYAGKKGKCYACGHRMRIPQTAAPSDAAISDMLDKLGESPTTKGPGTDAGQK